MVNDGCQCVKNRFAFGIYARYDSHMDNNSPRSIDDVVFIDGLARIVFEDADGRQFVVDDDGNRVYGVWVYIDEPIIVPIEAAS